ncbi:MAG TPA: hypothetical protein VN436_16895, partial [Holophaga sp.]|nr:hypothetical protein [Holophaga sp.]
MDLIPSHTPIALSPAAPIKRNMQAGRYIEDVLLGIPTGKDFCSLDIFTTLEQKGVPVSNSSISTHLCKALADGRV